MNDHDQPRDRGPWAFRTPPREAPAADLAEAVRALVGEMLCCSIADCGAPATRVVRGLRHSRRGGGVNVEVLVCDVCLPPSETPAAHFNWFSPQDLPYAAALRAVLVHLRAPAFPTSPPAHTSLTAGS